MMRVIACLLALLLPVQAAALSCVNFSVSEMFNEVNAADSPHVVFLGEVTYDGGPVSQEPPSDPNSPEPTYKDARMKGLLLTAVGKGRAVDEKIRLAHYCFGDWCGAMPRVKEVLTFVEKTEAGYTIHVGPCRGGVFSNPTKQMVRSVKQCLAGRHCPKN